MPSTTIDDFETAWVSTDPARLKSTTSSFAVSGATSLLVTTTGGAAGAAVTYFPDAPMDLRDHDELRFWCHADQAADGSTRSPFLLELGYVDDADAPGEEHRWLVPVNRPGLWEHHRIGIAGDRRTAITRWSLRVLTDRPVRAYVDELIAVTGNSLGDVEAALVDELSAAIALPGVTGIAVAPAVAGATTLTTALNPRLRAGNRITLDPPAAGLMRYAVTAASHDDGAGTTTLAIAPALAEATEPGATLSVVVPVVVEEAPLRPPAADLPDPVVLVALSDQREEPERGWNIPQRDSLRRRGALTVCSTWPAARPVALQYQILAAAGDREQSLTIRRALLSRVGVDAALRVNGVPLPVRTLLPPLLEERDRAVLAPIYLQVGATVEVGERQEVPWPSRGPPAVSARQEGQRSYAAPGRTQRR
jgi:hypothetical protein